MKLAHTGDDGLTRLFVRIGLEGGVLLRQLLKGDRHFLLTCFGLGLDGDTDDRLREFHGFQHYLVLLVTESIARRGIFKTDGCGDVARIHHAEILTVVCVHEQDTTDPLTLTL